MAAEPREPRRPTQNTAPRKQKASASEASVRTTPARTKRAAAAPDFPIVGIGASAGGLAAIEEFLSAIPTGESLGMAVVLVQHLDPDHESLLLDLVKKYTPMEIAWAEDGMEVRSGCAYIMPPDKNIALVGGRLCLGRPETPRGHRLPIDSFFRSLAADRHERAVCIVLSGTGCDGTLGLRAIKGEGGMAIAQTPETAAYDGMPRSAIATGLVDYVLSPADMPEMVLGYVGRAFGRTPELARATPEAPDLLPQVLHVLRDRSGHDFTHYRGTTLRRRVVRRMVLARVERMDDYVTLLKSDHLEVETLFRELLIGVTTFFRDPPAFEALAAEALPRLIAAQALDSPVRVWVPACSTGEEAYSIAILLQELADSVKRDVSVKLFATDIDTDAIERARTGVYPISISADVSPERLARFFVQDGDTYRVVKSVRDGMMFAAHDVTKDPPFSRLDLLSCRNLLIYMDGELQQRLMSMAYTVINPSGYLFLGNSESVGDAADLFAPIDKKWRLYQRRDAVTPRQHLLASKMSPAAAAGASQRPSPREKPKAVPVRVLTERALLDKHTPACVVINAEGDVLFIHGHTGRYLEPAAGEPGGNLVKMAREGLQRELAVGVHKALVQKKAVRHERLRVETDGGVSLVNLIIEPMSGLDSDKGALLVLFEDVPPGRNVVDATAAEPMADWDQRIADLERELSAKEEYLRTTVEELETSNEKAKSASEEMLAANEELQSVNEEMQNSREELQSLNEELVIVNSELRQKMEELARVNDDVNNMIAGTGVGTLFVDQQLRIQRFTPGVTAIMNLIPTDIGRPLGDITQRLKGDVDLVGAVTTVLETLTTVEAQVEDSDERFYQMRAQPYRTLENVIEGGVLTFADVTDQRRLQAKLDDLSRVAAEAGLFAQSVLDTVREPQLVLDGELAVMTANKAFLATFGLSPEAVLGRHLREVYGGEWLRPDLLELLLKVLPKKKKLDDYVLSLSGGALGPCKVTLNALELLQTPEKRRLMLLTVTNIDRDA